MFQLLLLGCRHNNHLQHFVEELWKQRLESWMMVVRLLLATQMGTRMGTDLATQMVVRLRLATQMGTRMGTDLATQMGTRMVVRLATRMVVR
jgi:hypothetical protein